MSSANDVLVHSLSSAKLMVRRFSEDLTPQEQLHRPTPKANCVAWLLGHLTLSNRRAATMMGLTDLPPLPDGFEKRFSRDEGCPQASEFADTSKLLSIYESHIDLLINAVKKAGPELLDKPLEKPMPGRFTTIAELVNFMCFHCVMHAGQITIIRRSLGRPPLV